jgi:hypothetical protein
MVNAFRYVINDNLYEGYSQPMPLECGKRVFRIYYPDHTDQIDDFFEVIETGDHSSPYKLKIPESFNPFYRTVIDWFADYRILTD